MSVPGLGSPYPSSNEPMRPSGTSTAPRALGQALEIYATLLSHPEPSNPTNLQAIAEQTVQLEHLAQNVINTAAPTIQSIGRDLEHLLTTLHSISDKNVSMLRASQDYLENPANADLGPLIQEFLHNPLTLKVMCEELFILSGSIMNPKTPSGFGS